MHEEHIIVRTNPLTTFTSYGHLDPHRQGVVIKEIGNKQEDEDKLDAILAHISKNKENKI